LETRSSGFVALPVGTAPFRAGAPARRARAGAPLVRWGGLTLDPLWGAGLRFALAAIVLAAAMAVLKLELPRGRALTGALLFGLLDVGGAFALGYYALVELHAGFGSILVALVPLATLLLAVLQGQESLRIVAVAGTLVALVGSP